ncbi:MAG: heme ABC exporter ATP-binding protein CcmA [Rhodospirillales bacterium]
MALFGGEGLVCERGGRIVFGGLGFAADPGDALVLTGPNGSGKSSLLRLMAGLTPPAAGRILWDGRPIAEAPETHAARLRFLGHLDAVKPALTVAQNLGVWLRLAGVDGVAAAAALDRFGLAALAGTPARFLSAGQRRRLALARIVAVPAPLWLLDEPTVALDTAAVAAVEAAIAAHRRAGGIVAVSTNVALAVPGARGVDVGRHAVAPDAA